MTMCQVYRSILRKVDGGRLGRAMAGLQDGWRFEVVYRNNDTVRAVLRYSGKSYAVGIQRRGRFCWCACEDFCRRGVICKHIAALAMSEMAAAARARSQHRDLERVGGQ